MLTQQKAVFVNIAFYFLSYISTVQIHSNRMADSQIRLGRTEDTWITDF